MMTQATYDTPALLHICTTCDPDKTRASIPDGTRLHERLATLLDARPELVLRLLPTKCLANCERGCSAAIVMPGKWSNLLGGLSPSLAEDLLSYAVLYQASLTGVVLPSRRPASLASMVCGRIPGAPPLDPAKGLPLEPGGSL